jgi:glucokinase
MRTNPEVLAVDLGGTNIRLGIVTPQGRLARRRRGRIPPPSTPEALYDSLVTRITGFIGSGGATARLGAVAVGFAGPTSSASGYVYCAPNLGQLEGLQMATHLERRLGVPVLVANDADCAAIGEYWRGAGRGAKSLFLFTLGTGVGGSLVIDGRLWEGERGIAGEIGHTVIALGGPRCSCGNQGCLEALVSATAIVRDYVAARKIKPPAESRITAKMVFDRARGGDKVAQRVIAGAAGALGVGIANVFNLLDPELILIGGGVSRAGSRLIGPAVKQAGQLLFAPLREYLRVRRTSLGDDAALLGAARLAFERILT